ncbi:MAG: alkaline phosphatase family protein [Halobacteriales archaeon]
MAMFDRFRQSPPGRVALLGLDGVPHSLVQAHAHRFEHLADLFEAGSATRIRSVVPPESSAAWASLSTGVNPGETGVYGLVDRETGSYGTYVTASNDVQAPRVWDRAAEADRPATVVNVPTTYPPPRNLQRMVSGFLAPDIERAVHPGGLASTLRNLGYVIDVDATLGREGDLAAFLEAAYDTLDARFEAFAHFIDLDDWDLFAGVFMTPDRVNHFLYGQYLEDGPLRDDFLAFYEQLDTYLGALRSRLPDDVTLLLASDHGFGPLEYEVDANAWLRSRDWLDYDADEPKVLADVDDRTRAYALAPGRFYLNLAGREPRGAVAEEEYEVVRAALAEELRDWHGPDGDPVVEEVLLREDHYRGPHLDLAPDLVALPAPGFDLTASFDPEPAVFRTTPRTGTHRVEDAFLAIDRPDVDLDGVGPYHVAPTVLDLMDVAYERSEFDGASVVGDDTQ